MTTGHETEAAKAQRLLAGAINAASEELGLKINVRFDTPGEPEWREVDVPGGRWGWVSPIWVDVESDGVTDGGTIYWPSRWAGCALPPPNSDVSAGVHSGLFLGTALATGQGVRLRPGLHFIPRLLKEEWMVSPVLAPDLGQEAFGSIERIALALYGDPRRYLAGQTRSDILQQLGLRSSATLHDTEKAIARALTVSQQAFLGGERIPPISESRTSYQRNRVFGADEVFAELLLAALVNRWAPPTKRQRLPADVPARRVVRMLAIAASTAVWSMARGDGGVTSVVTRSTNRGTLARIEDQARACFVGFRGLGKVRGRPDLRDLDPEWRYTLCPVQTPESTDFGLVRFATVGHDCPNHTDTSDLQEWLDLSASAALIPFINHNDPARSSIGSKNLKQAVPVVGCEPPLVATGWEMALGEAYGCVRATASGRVVEISDADTGVVVTEDPASRQTVVAFGAPRSYASGPIHGWRQLVAEGDEVTPGQILVHAPDVCLDPLTGQAELSLGVNALVALTPWHGLNHEDGIVVSQGFARRMASWHQVRFDQSVRPGDVFYLELLPTDTEGEVPVEEGETLAVVQRTDGTSFRVISPVTGTLTRVVSDVERRQRSWVVRVRRELEVGDKLTNRHQGKGVVSAILDDSEMPTLLDGTPIEVILNPVGVLRRLNIGQLWELHVGLRARLSGTGQMRVGRQLGDAERERLADDLMELGAPDGRTPLLLPDGTRLGGDDGVVVGIQYLIKLDHLAVSKLRVRAQQPWSVPTHGQPTQTWRLRDGVQGGSAQRIGEMEIWALEASGATQVLRDALQQRAGERGWSRGKVRASLRSVQAHLAVAGVGLHDANGTVWDLQSASCGSVDTLVPSLWDWPGCVELPGWRTLAVESKTTRRDDTDPLYDPLVHGAIGTAESEQLRYIVPLPQPVAHPWRPDVELTAVGVLPVSYRTSDPLGGRRGVDKLYQDLVEACFEFEKDGDGGMRRVEQAVCALLGVPPRKGRSPQSDSILGRLIGKRGLLRRYLVGQATCQSGRSVIVPDLTLRPDEVGLPGLMIEGLGVDPIKPEGDVVVVNRQPSLHPYNMVALRARVREGSAIRLHPLILTMLAGDFDGDTVAVHHPRGHGARVEALEKLSPAAFLRSWADGQVLAKADLDIALGLCLASDSERGRTALTAIGVPEGIIAARDIPGILDAVMTAQPSLDAALDAFDRLERLGLDTATGWSIGALEMLDLPEGGARLAQAVRAGAAGKPSGVEQLLHRRGAVPSAHPGSPLRDVPDSFLRGLASDDYFATSPAALASLAGKKLNSPHAGSLTKTLVEIADPVVAVQSPCDVPDEFRSPLTCRAGTGVCVRCYGILPGTGQPPDPGRRVGVLAATSIGERSTQLSMKAHHSGGKAGEVEGGIGQLRALFGSGASAQAFGLAAPRGAAGAGGLGRARSLRRFLDDAGDLSDPQRCLTVFEPVLRYADEVLQGRVARVHLAVILRQLLDTHRDMPMGGPSGHRSLIACAQRRGRSAFEVATQRGSVTWLFEDNLGRGGLRTKLVAGSVT